MRSMLKSRDAKPPKASRRYKAKGSGLAFWRQSVADASATPQPALLPQYTRNPDRRLGPLLIVGLAIFCLAYGYGFGTLAPHWIVQFLLPVLVLGGLVVWALPEFDKAPTEAMEKLFFIFFVSLPMWPNYLAVALPGLPWITVARILGFPLVFMLLLSISVSASFRADMAKSLSAVPLLWKAIAAFSILQVLSVALSNAPTISINKLLVAQVNWTAMFFISAFFFVRPGRIERWGVLLCIMALILGLIAVPEFMQSKPLWADHIPPFLAVEDESVQRVLTGRRRAGTDLYRVLGTFSTALGFSEFLALSTPFLLHFALGPFKIWLRLGAIATLPVVLNAIILTDSRLGMVGFLMSCFLYVFFWGALRWRQNPRSLIGPAVVLSYPLLAVMFVGAVLSIQRLRVMTLGGGKHVASTEARYDQVALGIPKLLSHPFGYGIGRGAEGLGYTNPGGAMTIDSYFLLIALDYGVGGFLLFYGIFIIAMWHAFRTIIGGTYDREQTMLVPLLIALFCYFVIKSIYAGVENQSAIYMMFGAIIALIYRIKQERPAHEAALQTAKRKPRRARSA